MHRLFGGRNDKREEPVIEDKDFFQEAASILDAVQKNDAPQPNPVQPAPAAPQPVAQQPPAVNPPVPVQPPVAQQQVSQQAPPPPPQQPQVQLSLEDVKRALEALGIDASPLKKLEEIAKQLDAEIENLTKEVELKRSQLVQARAAREMLRRLGV